MRHTQFQGEKKHTVNDKRQSNVGRNRKKKKKNAERAGGAEVNGWDTKRGQQTKETEQ
jgi:hypothetical protein